MSRICRAENATISHHILVLLRYAAHASGGVVPPLLLQQEGLPDEVERPFAPIFADKPPILRQRLDAVRNVGAVYRAAKGITAETDRLAGCLVDKLHALARRSRKMDRPVGITCIRAADDRPPVNRAKAACNERSVRSATAATA